MLEDIFEESKEFDIDDYEAELYEYVSYKTEHVQLEKELKTNGVKIIKDTNNGH